MYYSENVSEVSDAVYDQHFEELKKLEQQYPNLKHPNSPTTSLGSIATGNFKKFFHQKVMLSLNNAFVKSDLQAFHERVNKLTNNQHTYHCEPKIDGLSITLIFRDNNLVVGATRGNGEVGEDVTTNIRVTDFGRTIAEKCNRHLPPSDFEIRGEVFITKDDFAQLNKTIYNRAVVELENKFAKQCLFLKQKLKKCFFDLTSSTTYSSTRFPQIQFTDNLSSLLQEADLSTHSFQGQINLQMNFTFDD